MWAVVNSLRNCKVPFLRAVGFCSLPACLWYGGRCPEIKDCGLCPKISDEIIHAFEISVTVHEGQCLNVEGTKELNEKGYVNVKFEYGKELEDKNVKFTYPFSLSSLVPSTFKHCPSCTVTLI